MSLFIAGCDSGLTGTASENQAPSTNLTVESINRGDDFRLSSQINISWWGNDPDGYVVGYEYAINDTSESTWTFTEKSDSTFVLPITEGRQTDEVLFKVRAVDNEGAVDPVGARLVYPIINSQPSISFNQNETPPDSLFAITSFGWTVSDTDGISNVRSTEIAINDTINGWVDIPLTAQNEGRIFISLEVDNSTTGLKTADVFTGRGYSTGVYESGEPIEIPGIEVGAMNTAYIRSIDAAGAVSEVDSISWYVKPQRSKVLFLNDIGTSNYEDIQNEHLSYLSDNGISPDVWYINDGQPSLGTIELSNQFPTVVDPTLSKTLAKWDHIYWLSDDLDRNIVHALNITTEFFQAGGNMFINIPMKSLSEEDDVFNFIPVDSVGSVKGLQTGLIINKDVEISPLNGISDIVLKSEQRQIGVYPFKPITAANALYTADFRATTILGSTQDYTGYENVALENTEGDLIYFGLDLTRLNGNNNVADFIGEMCIQRLGFSN